MYQFLPSHISSSPCSLLQTMILPPPPVLVYLHDPSTEINTDLYHVKKTEVRKTEFKAKPNPRLVPKTNSCHEAFTFPEKDM